MVGSLVDQRLGSILALFALLAVSCHSDALESSEGPPPSVVETALVESRLFSERVEVVGQLAAAESVVIRPEISGVIESIEFQDPAYPVFSNVTARPVTSGSEARELLVEQLTSPVRWRASVAAMVPGPCSPDITDLFSKSYPLVKPKVPRSVRPEHVEGQF